PRAALHQLALAAAEQAPHARGHGLVEGLHVPALGIARAAEELPVAAEAHLHGTAALLAHLAGGLGLHRPDGPVVGAPEVLRVLALRVAAAGEELAPPAPLDDHRLPALLAHEVGRALLALHVAHQDLGLLEVPGEWPPEAVERVDVVLLALLDAVELALPLLLGIALLVVAALGVDADEAVELEDLAGGPEAAGTRLDVHRGGIVDGRFHLARHEAVPDERVERELVLVEVRRDALGLV